MNAPIVAVSHLRKTYPSTGSGRGAEKVAVDDVSFTIEPGEIFGILGPNGAGKTTTVECIAGLRDIAGGTLSVLGIDPTKNPEKLREHVGVQLQAAELHPKMTVAEALELFAAFYTEPADIEELIEAFDLTEFRDRQFGKLSGGQKQRLSIALALVGNPKIAILDELTTGLDPAARRATWAVIEKVRRRGVTILLVTHFMDEAERLCDRIVIIDAGRVIAEGTPAQLIESTEGARNLEDVFVTLTVPSLAGDLS